MTMRGHDFDVCDCGDYRHQHIGGTGMCKFTIGARGDGHFGAGRCDCFKLHQVYTAADGVGIARAGQST